jgi:putative DNA primase/helicase
MAKVARGGRVIGPAAAVAAALGGQRCGAGWVARCPAHEDREPSLSLGDGEGGRLLVHCHAGCSQKDVIEALGRRGLWQSGRGSEGRSDAPEVDPNPMRITAALEPWHRSRPAEGTIIATYLASRGLVLPPSTAGRLRFHQSIPHPSGGVWPAMVALVTAGVDDRPLGIHRTFLAPAGGGKAAVRPQKMMLGPCGGGAVRLSEADDRVMVGEGIETCLAAMQASGLPAWAALSTSGMRRLDLPDCIREVIVLADADAPGEAAAEAAARRWKAEGRRVRVARPPAGKDFNDALVIEHGRVS